MCLLVARKSGSNWLPSREEFDNAWSSNPHGFGFAYHDEKQGLMQYKTLEKESAWQVLQELPLGRPAILHWRLATHGSKTVANCHPFAFRPSGGDLWIGAHNGILGAQFCVGDKTDSESFMLSLKRVRIPEIEKAIARLGYGKMAFLSAKGALLIANEAQGKWRVTGEVWQSNSGMEDLWPMYDGGWQPTRRSWRGEVWERIRCGWCHETARVEWLDQDGDPVCAYCKADAECEVEATK